MIESLIKDKVDLEAAFESQIAGPLQSVLGKTLLAVTYQIIASDRNEFSVEQPNDTGVLIVILCFDQTMIEITPGWDKQLRSDGIYHHIQVVTTGKQGSKAAYNSDKLWEIAPIHASPWQQALGKRLIGVEVTGLQGTPQAIRLSFSDLDIVIAVGYAGSDPTLSDLVIGDGDEILIFSEQDWNSHANTHKQVWETLWMISATRRSKLMGNL
ncbi:MAG: hypothetical protein ACRYFS_14835 [Janthinobacterium lividum]